MLLLLCCSMIFKVQCDVFGENVQWINFLYSSLKKELCKCYVYLDFLPSMHNISFAFKKMCCIFPMHRKGVNLVSGVCGIYLYVPCGVLDILLLELVCIWNMPLL